MYEPFQLPVRVREAVCFREERIQLDEPFIEKALDAVSHAVNLGDDVGMQDARFDNAREGSVDGCGGTAGLADDRRAAQNAVHGSHRPLR